MTYFYTHRLVYSLTREGAFCSSLAWRLTTGQAVEKERLEKDQPKWDAWTPSSPKVQKS